MKTNENKEEKESKDDDEYEFPAFEFPEDESKIDGELISKEDIDELLLVLFGAFANPEDTDRWYSQGLGFMKDQDDNGMDHNNDIRFGLLQIHGGPCGVMAPVQVFTHHVFFMFVFMVLCFLRICVILYHYIVITILHTKTMNDVIKRRI